ncbi:pilus assembly protein PilO [Bacillus sp. HMF5848]|uniref:pilus assembly protein PilO n=1 Tax=Bacillus sp. HMF5848 TaxID=2495421 RepID=UPI000F76AEC0|nr:pilus assembly protein PilO [Bacillus sp. HMF5848]RSK28019.1 pilus assembly protein PilO [Bacillus sp. HMF5848]
MTITFSKKLILYTFVVLALLGATFFYLRLQFIAPLQQQVQQKENDLKLEKQLLEVVQSKVSQAQQQTYSSTLELQRKVPVKPLLDQFILHIEKAEVVSDSFIVNMSFNTNEEVNLSVLDEYEQFRKEEKELVHNDQTETEPEAETAEPESLLPEGMKKITVNLSVKSPDYYAMQTFLKSLEQEQRITQIDVLSFNGPEETTSFVDEADNMLAYSVTVSTFYHPTLEDLQDEVPIIEVPAPSEKNNPLANFIDMDKKKESDTND